MSGNDLIFNFFSENDPKGLEVIKNIFFKIIVEQDILFPSIIISAKPLSSFLF